MAMSGGIQGAGQGAQMGMSFGPWGAAIGAGIGFIAGSLEEDNVNEARAEALAEQAKYNRIEMARLQAEVNRARTMEIMNTAGAINYLQRVSGQQKADISVQNAQADAIGASAQAAMTDADAQLQQAKAESIRSLEYNLDNQDVQLDSALNQSFHSTRAMIEKSKSQDTSKEDMWSGILGLGQAGGSLWASGAFDSAPTTKSKTSIRGGKAYNGDTI